jgi:hypothetical protein
MGRNESRKISKGMKGRKKRKMQERKKEIRKRSKL